ncbi:hypothetical protein ABEW24_23930 [Paenibacillus jamilae]|uniref:hypothetical protein n=1 Tax=Paenibacillus TaxID=44249 RepID=UPI00077C2B71|nr:hypothetical protein [Paenibacillus polymyxa]KYG95701.1 hypothetical protein AZE31_18145 [Paenibacillus polymyxa]
MRYKNYYLIEWNNEHDLVLAESTREALELYFSHQQGKREKDGRRLEFDPRQLTIKEIQREDFLIKAP